MYGKLVVKKKKTFKKVKEGFRVARKGRKQVKPTESSCMWDLALHILHP